MSKRFDDSFRKPEVVKENFSYDIFISYRRKGGAYLSNLLYQQLKSAGYRVFLDTRNLSSGRFDRQLQDAILQCTDFILVLSNGSLERCSDPGDIVKEEIGLAIESAKNIIPVVMPEEITAFTKTDPNDPEWVKLLTSYESILIYNESSVHESIMRLETLLLSEPENYFPVPRPVLKGVCGKTLLDHVQYVLDEEGNLTLDGNGDVHELVVFSDGTTENFWGNLRTYVRAVYIKGNIRHLSEWFFSDFKNLETVVITAKIRSIPAGCFSECCKLVTVKMPNTVRLINVRAFYGCENLSAVCFSKNLRRIESGAFGLCSSLKSLYLPKGEDYLIECLKSNFYKKRMRSIKWIGSGAFENCGLTGAVISTSAGTRISRTAFAGCNDLETVLLEGEIPWEIGSGYKWEKIFTKNSVISGNVFPEKCCVVTIPIDQVSINTLKKLVDRPKKKRNEKIQASMTMADLLKLHLQLMDEKQHPHLITHIFTYKAFNYHYCWNEFQEWLSMNKNQIEEQFLSKLEEKRKMVIENLCNRGWAG